MKIQNITKRLLPLLFVLASAPSFAINASITKTGKPPIVAVSTGGSGSTRLYISSSDFPAGTLSMSKTLLGIDWTTTSYPSSPNETVQLCYYRPYTANPVACHAITRNSTGTDIGFNNQTFAPGVEVEIRHTINGGPQPTSPAGTDSVTFRYSY